MKTLVIFLISITSAYLFGEHKGYEIGFSKGQLDICEVKVRDKLNNKTWCVVKE